MTSTKMRFDIITIFPKLFDSFLNESLIKKSVEKKLNRFVVHDLRKWASGKHHQVDDRPFGGGAGMVLMAQPVIEALKAIKVIKTKNKSKIILLSPTGKQFNQKTAEKFAQCNQLIFICGRYEGVDARVERFVDEKISLGPFVLNGGEVAAMAMVEAVARLQSGFVGNQASLIEESFNDGQKEYPHYTRPEVLVIRNKKLKVPAVLLSGDHQKIRTWREKHKRK
jgi:tRNA (guanine37-N1)-methyltransferase